MDHLEQENHKLREEVTTLRAENEILRNLVSLMTVAQSQPVSLPIVSTQAQTVVPLPQFQQCLLVLLIMLCWKVISRVHL